MKLQKFIISGFNAFFQDWKQYSIYALLFLAIPLIITYLAPEGNWIFLGLVLSIVGSILFNTASMITGGLRLKKKKDVKAYKTLQEKIIPYLGTSILVFLTVLGVLAPFIAGVSILGMIYGETPLGIGLSIAVGFIGVLVALLISTFFVFANIEAVLGKHKYIAALKHSWKEIYPRFWKAVLYLFVFQLMGLGLVFFAQIVFSPLTILIPVNVINIIVSLVQTVIVVPVLLGTISWYYGHKKD